ncbi:MAG: T9SS type A sorting domain-containing protein [Bacteroidia bacterium]
MKKIITTILFSAFCFIVNAQFSPNNVVVLRVGDSVATLANTGNPLVLQQYTTSGALVNMTYLPRTGTNAVCLSGTATSEGALTLSNDRTSLNLIAYRVTPPHSASLTSTASSTINRAFVMVNASGVTSIPSVTASSFSANNPRAAFANGTNYYAVGANTGVVMGTNSTNLDTVISSTVTNLRNIDVFAGQLFYSTGSGTRGIYRVGNGIPTTSGQVATVYISTGSSASPYAFAFNNDTNICYIADDRAAGSGGGIQKWVRTGTVWNLVYTLQTGGTSGARGLTVNWNTGSPTLFATTSETRNRLIRIIDTGALSLHFTLDTAAVNTAFRGVTFTPGSNPLPVKFGSINIQKVNDNNAVELLWSTLTEINNSHFEIERSFDGETFEAIATIKGKGNSNKLNLYSFIDPNTRSAYYRIKQVDFDGNYEYSKTMFISFDEFKVVVSPNPFDGNISVSNNKTEKLNVKIIDLNGRILFETFSNEPNFMISTDFMQIGIYLIQVSNGVETQVKRIIKK